MKNKKLARILAAGAAAVCAGATQASAQSVDALLDKLVDKGILSVKEANDLKEESDQGFTTAYAVKSGMPDWVSNLKFSGDLRGRYESFYFQNDAGIDRQRYRYRMRFGVTAVIKDNFEVGLRLTSAEPASGGGNGGDPISGNATFQDNGSKKTIYLDLAYGKWMPINGPGWQSTFIVGKMENPFLFSDMIFDADYTPEGAAFQLGYNFTDKHSVKLHGGGFLIDEIGGDSNDPYWLGGQVRLDSTWTKKLQSSLGFAGLMIDNEQTLNLSAATTWTVPNQNAGNSRSAVGVAGGGTLLNHYNPLVADVGMTYTLDKFWHYNAPFPIRIGGEYLYNPAASSQNVGFSGGLLFGKSGKKGLWDLSYKYKYLEGDAWYEEFVDSDFGAFYQAASARTGGATGYLAGTNIKGHVVKASYSVYDALTLAATVFFADTIQESPDESESGTTRVQVDATLRF